MKTTVFRGKRLVYLLLLIMAFLFVVNTYSTTVYASTMTNPIISRTPLTEMDDLELVNFAVQNGIDVPSDLIDSVEFGSAIKDIIQESPRSGYSFTITQDLAEKIQVLIDVYQGNSRVFLQGGMSQDDQFSIMSVSSHTLENNLVMHNGSWSSTGGDWSSSYLNYNCYSFAIDKTDERYRYPGQHSGVSMVYNYMSLYSISQMATFVKNDLEALGGYGDVSVYSSEPSNIQLWQTLICIRKGSSDYHFMKYDKLSQAWYHKPGGTAPLKYLHHPEDIIWVSEYSSNGVCYNADDQLAMGYSLTTYTSEVYYIVYGEHPFTTNTEGPLSNQISITGVKSGVTLIGSITIPEFLNSRNVIKIGSNAFSGQTQLTQITIPSSVTYIGSNAFHNNTSVYWLGNYAFRDNIFLESLNEQTEFTVPDVIAGKTIIQIANYAFANNTTLTKVTIPSSIAYIGDHAFSNCTNLAQVDITDETTSILGSTPFSGCPQLYGTILSIKTGYHRMIDNTGRLIWLAHDFVYDGNHSTTHHDLVCQSCGYEDTESHNKQVVDGIEVCITCPWVGDVHTNHEHTHSYIPIPHSGKFPVNKHTAYCYCGEYIEEMCLGQIESDGKAYCIYCHRDMSGALGPIINRILLPESEFHDHDICCIDDCHLNDYCNTKSNQNFCEPNNVLYIEANRKEKKFLQ